MKINIREKIFETNSSSSHSLAISPGTGKDYNFYLTDEEKNSKTVVCEFGEYHWGYDVLRGAREKLEYLLTALSYMDNSIGESLKALEESAKYIEIKSLIKDKTGLDIVLEPCAEDDDCPLGSIDHQSCDNMQEWLSCGVTIEDFIFDTKYRVIIDNDNH